MDDQNRRASDLSPEEYRQITKEALKEGIKEWLDGKAQAFGWFSIRFLGFAALAAVVLFILSMNGWELKP